MTCSRVALSSMPRIMRASSSVLRARCSQRGTHQAVRRSRQSKLSLQKDLIRTYIFLEDERAAAAPAFATPAAFPSANEAEQTAASAENFACRSSPR